jgi:hypothetical protein
MTIYGKEIIVSLTLLILCSTTAYPQDNNSVCARVEIAVTKKAPAWKLTRKSKSCGGLSYFQWTSGKSQIYVSLYPGSSNHEAVGRFQMLESDDELLGEKIKVLGTGIREVGDDNRLWRTPTFGARGIDFRKGNVVVRVSGMGGTTLELALEFAANIFEALPAAEQALGADSP